VPKSFVKPFVRRLALVVALVVLAACAGFSARRELLPFGIDMPDLAGNLAVDPRAHIAVEAVGVGARLAGVEVRDESGALLKGTAGQRHYDLDAPLAFGTRYTVKATVERPWFGQRETREIAFATVAVPKLEGSAQRALTADASVSLSFDRPVGRLEATGDPGFAVEPAPDHRSFRLIAGHYVQDQTYPVTLNLWTDQEIPLPPLRLEISTPPPLTAEISNNGQTNLGLAMPIRITFGEPLADRDGVSKHISVSTKEGKDIPGKWQWINKHRLQFTPEGGWPASSTIRATVDPVGPKSLRGGVLAKPLTTEFSTGSDRKILVYLDTQRAAAVENGQVVRTFAVSTGKPKTPTVTGSFYIYARFPVKTMRSRAKPGEKGHYVVEDVPYAQYFYEDYAFHGAWWHNGFGHPASHGCVNMSTRKHNRRWPGVSEDAGWLYQWASLGVPVSVLPRAPTQVATNEDSPAPKSGDPAAANR
jgi:lipoprotein-anchoring transpeptidase ErfK/SrfK